ncbi:MAG: response regulator [Clostridiaceae bacterium]|nr:response regulator [Clostridiaceae bacterium]
MSILKNLKLGAKLSVGFGSIILLLLITVLFGYFGLSRINGNFSSYRTISVDTLLIGDIQENLLESRINFKNFVQVGDEKYKIEFEEHSSKIKGFINDLQMDFQGTEQEQSIRDMSSYFEQYSEGFLQVVEYRKQRNDIYNNVLITIGPELEQNLNYIMETSYENNDEDLYYVSSKAYQFLLLSRVYVAKFLETNSTQDAEAAKAYFVEMDEWLIQCQQFLNDEQLRDVINQVFNRKQEYSDGFDKIVDVIEARNQIISRMDEIGPKITTLSDDIKTLMTHLQEQMVSKVKQSNDRAMIAMFILVLSAFILSVFITIIIVRLVVAPVRTVTSTFKDISEGDANLEVRLKANSEDELGDMAKYFNIFMCKLQTIIQFNKDQNWLKTGQAELNELIQNEQDIYAISNRIITYISNYVNAQVGALFVKADDNQYKMLGSYAYKRRKNMSNSISIGEGLVGQVALEKQTIILSNVPQDYIKITSGTGEALPKSLLLTPCFNDNEVKCIIELGSFEGFSDIQLEFIEQVSDNIANRIQAVESRQKMKELLDKSLELAEELQVQQEELQQSNEELEEQARALKESEARLQAQQEELRQNNEELEEQAKALKESEAGMQSQQEELRVINEELEERTKSLEAQKNNVNQKNERLINAQKIIEEKAQALEVTSKYKSEFLANMSHELRTPLNSILVLSQMLAQKKDNTPLSDKQLEFAKVIHASGEDLLKLINDILDLSKVEAGKMDIVQEEIYIDNLVQDINRLFSPIAAKKDLEFIITVHPEAPIKIISDYQRLQQVIRNLLSNAFKFTEKGSVLMIIDKGIKEDKAIHQDFIKISIIDTGIGIAKDKQKVIFEAFKQSDGTTSRKYGGTGLGLSISRDLASLLGGSIELSSAESEGSTFTLIIPTKLENSEVGFNSITEVAVTKEVETVTSLPVLELEEPNDDRKTIGSKDKVLLVIEDDPNFALILLNLAYEKGYKCIIANDGETGLKMAFDYKPNAILLDIGLPDILGWKVIERLKANEVTAAIPIHVVSGGEVQMESKALESIIGYLKKPASIENLDLAFEKFEVMISKPFKKILIADESNEEVEEIRNILENKGIQIVSANNGSDVLNILESESVDCIILDLKLKDMSGFELLQKLKDARISHMPIIIHTDKVLTQGDEEDLRKYADSIIIKGTRSVDRLVDEASLFLHDIESKIGLRKIKAIKSEQDKEDALKDKKVLVVDDDMRNVFALSSILEEKGMKVIIGRNGKEGIKKLQENSDIDLILMDIMMPEMDGYDAMRAIRKDAKYRNLPIIALTAKAMKEDKQKCIEAGASDYLTKPLDIDKLTSLLRVWLY